MTIQILNLFGNNFLKDEFWSVPFSRRIQIVNGLMGPWASLWDAKMQVQVRQLVELQSEKLRTGASSHAGQPQQWNLAKFAVDSIYTVSIWWSLLEVCF